MSANQTTDDRRTAEQSPITVRMDGLAERLDTIVESSEFDNRSDAIREAVDRLVTEHECKQRLTEQGETPPPNLDGVIDRAPDSHPLRTDGPGESA